MALGRRRTACAPRPETARRIHQLRKQHRAAVTAQLGRAAGNGHKILESLFDRPILISSFSAMPTSKQMRLSMSVCYPVSEWPALFEAASNAEDCGFKKYRYRSG
jgi:hypothetical protein